MCGETWVVFNWLQYNANDRLEHIDYFKSLELAKQYKKAVSGKHKYCKCKNTGAAITKYWKDWHCTYCLKHKKSEKF